MLKIIRLQQGQIIWCLQIQFQLNLSLEVWECWLAEANKIINRRLGELKRTSGAYIVALGSVATGKKNRGLPK